MGSVARDLTTPRTELFSNMSTHRLTKEAIALPLAERVSLVQALWESIDAGMEDYKEEAFLDKAGPRDPAFWEDLERRSREMTEGTVPGIPYDQAMKTARAAIGCA